MSVSACSTSQEAAAKEGSRSAQRVLVLSLVSSYRRIERVRCIYILYGAIPLSPTAWCRHIGESIVRCMYI